MREATRRRAGDAPPRSRSPKATANTKYRSLNETPLRDYDQRVRLRGCRLDGLRLVAVAESEPGRRRTLSPLHEPGYLPRSTPRSRRPDVHRPDRSQSPRAPASPLRVLQRGNAVHGPARCGAEPLGRTAEVWARLPGVGHRPRRRRPATTTTLDRGSADRGVPPGVGREHDGELRSHHEWLQAV